MGIFSKKSDPISQRARKLEAEIAELESQIEKLKKEPETPQPRYRSTALPHQPGAERLDVSRSHPEPIFEEVDHASIHSNSEKNSSPLHYNEAGVRKFDLVALWDRCISFIKPPAPSNPKLLSLLAAGNIKGLQPLRREKRIARRRVILLAVIFLFLLWFILGLALKKY
jgi:cell division protein FtsB